jgi:hypothetical protein
MRHTRLIKVILSSILWSFLCVPALALKPRNDSPTVGHLLIPTAVTAPEPPSLPDMQSSIQQDASAIGSEEPNAQNNIDSLWTWSINGAKVAGSLAILTGSVKIIQAVLAYWRDEVLTWWGRVKQRWHVFWLGQESKDMETKRAGIRKSRKGPGKASTRTRIGEIDQVSTDTGREPISTKLGG